MADRILYLCFSFSTITFKSKRKNVYLFQHYLSRTSQSAPRTSPSPLPSRRNPACPPLEKISQPCNVKPFQIFKVTFNYNLSRYRRRILSESESDYLCILRISMRIYPHKHLRNGLIQNQKLQYSIYSREIKSSMRTLLVLA